MPLCSTFKALDQHFFILPEFMQLMEPENFYYLRQSGCVSDPTINDVEDFTRVSNHQHSSKATEMGEDVDERERERETVEIAD